VLQATAGVSPHEEWRAPLNDMRLDPSVKIAGWTVSFGLTGCASLQKFHVPVSTQPSLESACPVELRVNCQRLLDSAINEHALVGAQVSLSIGDKIKCHVSSGTTDRDRQHPMLPTHLIRIGSLTKTYTSVVVLRLMEKGLLALDSPISRWFPEYRFAERITVKMLLNHSSGIRELLGPRAMLLSTVNSRRVWTTPDLLEMIFGPDLEFEPGSNHRYSNSNYVLLAACRA